MTDTKERLWTAATALRGAADANRYREASDRPLQGLVAAADLVAAELDALAALPDRAYQGEKAS